MTMDQNSKHPTPKFVNGKPLRQIASTRNFDIGRIRGAHECLRHWTSSSDLYLLGLLCKRAEQAVKTEYERVKSFAKEQPLP